VTLLVHDNQIYGLTKGQASPTTSQGFVTKAQPAGVASASFNPIAVAVAMEAGFVARGFSGMIDHLSELIQEGIAHPGFSLIDILQPCVSFNKVNTFAWYKERCSPLPQTHDPADWDQAMKVAMEWGEKIPVGIIYRNTLPPFEENFSVLSEGPLAGREVDRAMLTEIMNRYG
jgi:2-oxoglutarate ferredoxin oxidoreductase subunit beta